MQRKTLGAIATLVLTVGTAVSPAVASHTASAATVQSKNQHSQQAQQNIVEIAKGAGQFKTLLAAATEAGLVETLVGEGPLTVFAPTDEAFSKLGSKKINELLKKENREALRTILTYHVVPGNVPSSRLVNASGLGTASGQRLDVAFKNGSLFIDKSKVIAADIRASNGVVHVIDTVMVPTLETIPEVAKKAGKFKTLLAAVDAAGLSSTLMGDGPFTVLAPTDEAFKALGDDTIKQLLRPESRARLQQILTYHVIPARAYANDAIRLGEAGTVAETPVTFSFEGGTLKVNGANIVATDIEAFNGVIHVIDSVLIPPQPEGRLIIGIQYRDPSSSERNSLGLRHSQGIVVTGLTPGGGAERAGLRAGEIITRINGKPATIERLREAIAEVGLGGRVEIATSTVRSVEVVRE